MSDEVEVKEVGPQSSEDFVVLPEEVEPIVAAWLKDNLFVPAQKYRTNVAKDEEWPTWRKLWNQDQWSGEEQPEDYPPFTGNIIMPTIDTIAGIALQTPSVVEFAPMEPQDEMFAMQVTAVVGDYLWSVRKARFKLGVGFREGAIIGTAWSKTFWNPTLLGGDGDVDFVVLPAEEVFVDPSCTGINDWQYIIHAPRRPVLEVRYSPDLYNERRLLVESDAAPTEGQKEDTAEQEVELVTVYEYWLKGSWLRAFVAENPEIEKHVDDDGWKYGISVAVASDKVLYVKPHPWKCDRFPLQRFVYYTPVGNQRIYGDGEPKFLKDTQLSFNARMTQMLNQGALIANNQWVISSLVVMDEEELTNEAGKRIHVDGPPDGIKRIEPTGISSSLFSLTNLLLELQQIIPGMYDVNRGQTPGSLRAGVAIQALQRGGEGRTRQKATNFDEWVADIGMGMLDIMAVMYEDERVFRIVGSPAEDIKSLEPKPVEGEVETGEDDFGEQQNVADVTGQVRSTEVKLSKGSFWRDDKRIELDVRAQVGMMMRSSEDQLQRDLELLERGAVDAQYVIENNQLRGKERLLARLAATVQQNAGPTPGMGEVAPEDMAPSGIESNSEVSDEEAMGMNQAIEQAIAEIQAAEDQGLVPRGFTANVQQAVMAEIEQGGTGENALREALAIIQQLLSRQGAVSSVEEPTPMGGATPPGMAGGASGMPLEGMAPPV